METGDRVRVPRGDGVHGRRRHRRLGYGASGDTRRVAAIICTVNLGKRDSEIKLLLGCSREETAVILRQHNVGQQRGVLIRRP